MQVYCMSVLGISFTRVTRPSLALNLTKFCTVLYPEFSGSLASGWSPGDQPLAKEPEDSGYEIEYCVSILYDVSYVKQPQPRSQDMKRRDPWNINPRNEVRNIACVKRRTLNSFQVYC